MGDCCSFSLQFDFFMQILYGTFLNHLKLSAIEGCLCAMPDPFYLISLIEHKSDVDYNIA